jgi:hypothetical protein
LSGSGDEILDLQAGAVFIRRSAEGNISRGCQDQNDDQYDGDALIPLFGRAPLCTR